MASKYPRGRVRDTFLFPPRMSSPNIRHTTCIATIRVWRLPAGAKLPPPKANIHSTSYPVEFVSDGQLSGTVPRGLATCSGNKATDRNGWSDPAEPSFEVPDDREAEFIGPLDDRERW